MLKFQKLGFDIFLLLFTPDGRVQTPRARAEYSFQKYNNLDFSPLKYKDFIVYFNSKLQFPDQFVSYAFVNVDSKILVFEET